MVPSSPSVLGLLLFIHLGAAYPQQQTILINSTSSPPLAEAKNVTETRGPDELNSTRKGRHATFLDIDENDLSDAEKEAKKEHLLREHKRYVPEVGLQGPVHDEAYIRTLQDHVHETKNNSTIQNVLAKVDGGDTVVENKNISGNNGPAEPVISGVDNNNSTDNPTKPIESESFHKVSVRQYDDSEDGQYEKLQYDEDDPRQSDGDVNPEGFIMGDFGTVLEHDNSNEHDEANSPGQIAGRAFEINDDEGDEHVDGENSREEGFATEDPSSLKIETFTTIIGAEVVDADDDCSSDKGPLRHVSVDSKYYVERSRVLDFWEGRKLCQKCNLVLGEVEGIEDHRTIERFITAGNYHEIPGTSVGSRFFIGLNDIRTEGVYKFVNGKNATFQNFHASQPDDKDQSEDCVTITKEHKDGPSGAADYDCNKTAHVFCMYRIDSQCYNDSRETKENRVIESKHELHLLVTSNERGYFISTYQLTWKEAMKTCDSRKMKLFQMDGVVSMGFFRAIVRWENKFFRVPMPTVQYWTSGKFQKNHMTAPVIWRSKTDPTESEERGVEKQNATFSFSGMFRWSTKKKADPGGAYGFRRDLCVSFGMEYSPDETPYMRNTNCDLPTYFICYQQYAEEGVGMDTTTEETVTLPPGPRHRNDLPPSPRAFNVTEIAETEKKMEQTGATLNITCSTIDEDNIPGRDGNIGQKYRWKHGFYVYLDPSYDTEARKLINAAMYELQQHLCIPFYLFEEGQKPYGDFVHVKNKGPDICKSEVGKIGIGGQNMFLGEMCLRKGSILHQMIHALGFWHEQSRPDRDKYVKINWNNVVHTTRSKFEMIPKINTFGVEYDTQSIMHFHSKAFSSNGKSTIVAKNGEPVGTKHDLRHSDILKLGKMYNCNHKDLIH